MKGVSPALQGTSRVRSLARFVQRRMKGEKVPVAEIKKAGLSPQAVRRAMIAQSDGRPLGRLGRPRLLSDASECELRNWVPSRPHGEPPTLKLLAAKV